MGIKQRKIEDIIKKIKKDLIGKRLYEKHTIVLNEKSVSSKHEDELIIENEIEKGLITARDYSNPTTILPMNPITLILKKTILLVMRVFTKSQIVFNRNILYSANKLYQYLLHLSEEIKENDESNFRKISDLEKRIKILEKKLKE